jgi:hypothetical protein
VKPEGHGCFKVHPADAYLKSRFLYGPEVDMVLFGDISLPRNYRIGFRNPIVRPPLLRAKK